VESAQYGVELGFSASSAGDLNGDGFGDAVVGVPMGYSDNGNCFVLFGGGTAGVASISPYWGLDGKTGFQIVGNYNHAFACSSVSSAGDVNSDGFDDLIIGAYQAPTGEAGYTYVIFGGHNVGSAGTIMLSTLDGTNGFYFKGTDSGDYSGYSISSAGDVNGDSHDDFLIGAYGANQNIGVTYVVFGGAGLVTATVMSYAFDGSNGFVINGQHAYEQIGYAVSGAGDFNGDGYDDILVGSKSSNGNCYLIYGKPDIGSSGQLDVSDLDGQNGMALHGFGNGAFCDAVSNAGDFNGDGYDDILIGSGNAKSHSGKSYIVYGASNFPTTDGQGNFDLSTLGGDHGFSITNDDVGGSCGYSVSSAGDFNGDGYDDVIIGAPYASYNDFADGGVAYLLYGGINVDGDDGTFDFTTDLFSENGADDVAGVAIFGEETYAYTGYAVGGGFDFDNDGFDDIVVGAYGYSSNSGMAYIIFNFDSSNKHSDSSSSSSIIASLSTTSKAIVVACCGLFLLCSLLVCMCRRSRKQSEDQKSFLKDGSFTVVSGESDASGGGGGGGYTSMTKSVSTKSAMLQEPTKNAMLQEPLIATECYDADDDGAVVGGYAGPDAVAVVVHEVGNS
jgi:hypothetical protein